MVVSGGEPTQHPKIAEFLTELKRENIQIGLKTNGVNLSKPTIRTAVLESCDWVGFSVDAATAETYMRSKKCSVQAFGKVIENIKWLTSARGNRKKPRVTMKFLIHHTTFRDGYAFCDLAKSLGADEVMIRPVYIPKYSFTRGIKRTAEFFLREARNAFEDDNFKIYGLVYKMEREWDRAIRFKTCFGSTMGGVMAADGKFYVCSDQRGNFEMCLGDWHPFDKFLEMWGSPEHRDMVKTIVPATCPKCSLGGVNELANECIVGDKMFLDFI